MVVLTGTIPALSPMRYHHYRTAIILFCFYLFPTMAVAQGENNIWAFGMNNGLNFNSGTPAPFSTVMQTAEGCAAVCNAAGQLLFYSNGNKVFNANHAVMPNGSGILGNYTHSPTPIGSACQGVAIVPAIGNSTLYYLFTVDPLELVSAGEQVYTRYTVIDMSLNGGLGDVLPTQKNIVIDSGMGEKIAVASGVHCSNWVIVHKLNDPEFHSFHVDRNGVNPVPVISVSGLPSPGGYQDGYFKLTMSPNDSLLVNNRAEAPELHDFNRATGVLSNYRKVLTPFGELNYGAAFSADGKKLYISRYGVFKGVSQFDASLLPNMAAFNASRIFLDTTQNALDMRRGPDGKIYIIREGGFISRIDFPNLPGTACGYVHTASLGIPASTGMSLGNPIVVAQPDTITYHSHDTSVCFGPPLTITAPAGFTGYVWSDGKQGQTDTVTGAAIKWSISKSGCTVRIDTFRVRLASDTLFFSRDTTACLAGGPVTLTAPQGFASRTWSDGNTTAQASFSTAGKKWVISRNACHYRIDTILVRSKPFDTSFHRRDTTVCFPATVHLSALPNYQSYEWNDGSQQQSAAFTTPGQKWVTARMGCSIRIDTIRITAGHIDTTFKTVDTTLCFSPQLTVNATGGYNSYLWDNGATGQSLSFTAPAIHSVYMQNGCFARMEIFRAAYTDFTVSLGADTVLCAGDSIMLDATIPNAQYTWQNGAHTPIYSVRNAGRYTVQVNVGNCTKTAAVNIGGKTLSVDLGDDRELCNGEEIVLNAVTAGVAYLWQDGSTGTAMKVTAAGKYWVFISQSACQAADTVNITYHNCDCRIIIPNAFTPNHDGNNDIFRAKVYGEPAKYELKVYNRWGQCIFTSFDPKAGWDGTYNGQNCDLGTYYYQVTSRCFRDRESREQGEVTLIR